MTTTTEPKDIAAAKAASDPGRPRDARGRARAYLDLWERHLTHFAVEAPPPPSLAPPTLLWPTGRAAAPPRRRG